MQTSAGKLAGKHEGAPMGRHGRSNVAKALTAGLLLVGLAGCSDSFSLPKMNDLNPFLKKEPPLAGTRVPIMEATGSLAGNLAPAERPIALPAPQANDAWAQPGGVPSNSPVHVALAASLKQSWSADAGTGSSTAAKLTASPIVYDGRVYTLDATARVSAFAVTGGSAVWRVSLVPEKERKAGGFFSFSNSSGGGYGGGLAADAGRLYVATGYGMLVALDPKTGKVLWEKFLRIADPLVADGSGRSRVRRHQRRSHLRSRGQRRQ